MHLGFENGRLDCRLQLFSWNRRVLSHNTVVLEPAPREPALDLVFWRFVVFPWLETTCLLIYGVTPEGSLCPLTLLDTAPFVRWLLTASQTPSLWKKNKIPQWLQLSVVKNDLERKPFRSGSVPRDTHQRSEVLGEEEEETRGTLHPNPLLRWTPTSYDALVAYDNWIGQLGDAESPFPCSVMPTAAVSVSPPVWFVSLAQQMPFRSGWSRNPWCR